MWIVAGCFTKTDFLLLSFSFWLLPYWFVSTDSYLSAGVRQNSEGFLAKKILCHIFDYETFGSLVNSFRLKDYSKLYKYLVFNIAFSRHPLGFCNKFFWKNFLIFEYCIFFEGNPDQKLFADVFNAKIQPNLI